MVDLSVAAYLEVISLDAGNDVRSLSHAGDLQHNVASSSPSFVHSIITIHLLFIFSCLWFWRCIRPRSLHWNGCGHFAYGHQRSLLHHPRWCLSMPWWRHALCLRGYSICLAPDQPPTGANRWRNVAGPSIWVSLNATKFGPQCVQTISDAGIFSSGKNTISEDCLYLKMWTPA